MKKIIYLFITMFIISCGIEEPILHKNTNSNIITTAYKSGDHKNMCYYHVNGSLRPFIGLCNSWKVGDTLKIIE